jgi:hypothetical protein
MLRINLLVNFVSQRNLNLICNLANEQLNLSNNLKVQKEARERELKAAKESITSLKEVIKKRDHEILELKFCNLLFNCSLERITE